MNTNFFNQIAQLNITGILQLNITKGAENNLVVSVMLNNDSCGDKAKDQIPPLTLRATAEELDNGFFDKITAPMEVVSGLMDNMEIFLKQVEEAKKQSAMEKGKEDKLKKEKEVRDKKYKDAMAKVAELEKEGKHQDAWLKVPEPSAFPDHAETIRKRKMELSAKFAPDLFGAVKPATPSPMMEHSESISAIREEPEEEGTIVFANEGLEE